MNTIYTQLQSKNNSGIVIRKYQTVQFLGKGTLHINLGSSGKVWKVVRIDDDK